MIPTVKDALRRVVTARDAYVRAVAKFVEVKAWSEPTRSHCVVSARANMARTAHAMNQADRACVDAVLSELGIDAANPAGTLEARLAVSTKLLRRERT